MTLIIEDGSIVDSANSYITVAEYNDWADVRFGVERESAPVDLVSTERLIFRAMDYFEKQKFQGERVSSAQPLAWPRVNVVFDRENIPSLPIPQDVKRALFEITYAEEQGNGELNPLERRVTSEKVGNIAVTYSENSSSRKINVSVSQAMRKLLGFNSQSLSVNRV